MFCLGRSLKARYALLLFITGGNTLKKTVHTVVEVFDTVNLQNNIMAALTFGANRVIFLYESGQEETMEGVCAFLKEKKPKQDIDKILVDLRSAKHIVQELFAAIHAEGKEVLVDINGGSSIVGNYARECCRQYSYPCAAIDVAGGVVVGIEHATEWEGEYKFRTLTFQDILLLQGRTYNRNMHMLADEEYFDRILDICEYAFEHQQEFKLFYSFVHNKSGGELSEPDLKIVLNKAKDKGLSGKITDIFRLFVKHEFITDLVYGKEQVTFTCVAPFVKEMLAVQGSWLEMYVYILAKRSGLFSEVYQSVMIGWDLQKRPKFNVENEIDVVLMKQGRPIFMSCKMTNPKPDALNEIYALADSFGGYGAIPALATSSDVKKRATTLWNRAQEMNVALVDYHMLNRKGLQKFFEKL